MSTYQLEIDGSSAESGANRIVKSFDNIKAAADRMEGGVSAAAKRAVASFNSLTNARPVSQAAIDSLKSLSSAMSTFKGPSRASVDNTVSFLTALKAVGAINVGSGRALGSFLSVLSGYKGPSPTAGKNTQSLLRSLQGFTGLGTGATRGLAATLTALSGFKGPSISGARNTKALLDALAKFTPPAGLASTARAFINLAQAAERASGAVGRLRAVATGTTTINVNTRKAQNNLADLTRQHGLLQTSILRTQTAMHALGGVLGAKFIIQAANDIIRIQAQLEAATGSVQQARVQFAFLRDTAEKMGLEFVNLSRSYGFFLGSIKGTNVTFEEARQVFVGFSTAARALQLSTSDVDGVFRALGQIMSKGKLQAEELRGQLGDRLPGAFVRFARALDLTKPGQLDDALKKGAISGDKLKKAIIEVASTLEIEFAASADKMSKTVDAAFNRLRNAFTFASADLGNSGLNEGLINITDALTKFIKSEGLGATLRILGRGFKFLGDNIEFVASILGGVALAATIKFTLASLRLNGVLLALTGTNVAKTMTVYARALSISAVSSNALTASTKRLTAAMLRNPFVLIGAAIAGLIYVIIQLRKKQDEARESLNKVSGAQEYGANILDAYTARLADNTAKLDRNTQALRDQALAQLQLNQLKAQQVDFGVSGQRVQTGQVYGARVEQTGSSFDSRTGAMSQGGLRTTQLRANRSGIVIRYKGQIIRGQAAEALTGLGTFDQGGNFRLRDYAANEQEFRRGALALGQGQYVAQNMSGPGGDLLRDVISRASESQQNVRNRARFKDPTLRFDPEKVLGNVYGQNWEGGVTPPGLSGEPVEKPGKKDRSAEAAARADEQDIRRALNSLRDLRREISAAEAAIASLSDGSTDVVAAQARAAAVAKVDNFEDSFQTVSRAQAGLVKLAGRMKAEGYLDAGVDISSYERAKEAVTSYTAALEESSARRKLDLQVAENTNSLEKENSARQKLVERITEGGVALQRANISLEVEKALIGTSTEGYNARAKALRAQIELREQLNRAEASAEAIREARQESQLNKELTPLYARGATEKEIDYYRELLEFRNKLINDGYYGAELQGRVRLQQALMDERLVMQDVQKEYEKLRQLAQDQADAIVGSFRDGIESGQSFLKTFKNIFTELKNIILDFVLYNPLKEFLSNMFLQQGAATYGNSAASRMPAAGMNTRSSFTPAGLLSTLGGITSTGSTNGSSPVATGGLGGVGSPVGALAIGVAAGMTKALTDAGADQDITVTGYRIPKYDVNAPISQMPPEQRSYFGALKGVFDFKTNGSALKNLGANIKGATKGVATATKDLSSSVGPALQAAGNAFAAYSIGSQVGKALGLGRVGSSTLGGAAAGFSLGGPVGAAIGAVAGLAKGLLFKPKTPSAYGSVTVSEAGVATGGAGGKYGKGDASVGKAMAAAGASIFNDFAREFDGMLKAGTYGTFGRRQFDKKSGEQSFYSLSGRLKKGKPVGREGVDWIRGTESEVQAFALKNQINRGQVAGLDPSVMTVARNTRATTMEGLQADLSVATAYDEFIRGSFQMSDLAKQVETLNESFRKLRAQSTALGLSEDKLARARDRMVKTLRDDLNFEVNQGILGYENPALAAYNQIVKEYRDTVENAMAVGGDLAAVEKYYGLKRKELAEQAAKEQNNAIRTAAQELLTSLTASSSSPLNAGTVLANSRDRYQGLRRELESGNYANVDKLQTFTQNYLDAARSNFASGTGYFDIFRDVTSFLQTISDVNSTTSGGDVPALPTLDALVNEIKARNQELVDVQKDVGLAVVEGTGEISHELKDIKALLGQYLAGQAGAAGLGLSILGGGDTQLRTISHSQDLL